MKVRFALLAGMAILAAPLAAQGGNAGMRMGGGMTGAAPSIDSLRAQLALTALLARAPRFDGDVSHPDWKPTTVLRGLRSLPLSLAS